MTQTTKISAPKATKSIYADIRNHTDIPPGEAIELSARLVALFNQTARQAFSGLKGSKKNRLIHVVDDSEITLNFPRKPVFKMDLVEAFSDGGWGVLADEKEIMMAMYDDETDAGYSLH